MIRGLSTVAAFLTLLAVGAGCTSDAPASDGEEAGDATTSNVSLATTNDSGVQGLVTVSGGGEVMFKLELMGLTSGETYTAALHTGSCESPGEKLTDLNSATSGGIGIGSSVTQVARDAIAEGETLHIQAHLPDGTLAACGNVPPRLLAAS